MNPNSPKHLHRKALMVVFVITAVLLAAVSVLGLFVYQNYVDVESDRLALATDLAKESSLFSLKDLTEKTLQDKESLTGFVITKDSLFRFADLVEEVGSKNGATSSVSSLDELGMIDKKTKKNILIGWKLELRLEGDFDQVWSGIRLIEALPVAKQVTNVSLVRTSVPESVGPVRWGGSVTLELPTIK